MLRYRKFTELTDEEIIFIIKEIFPNTTKVDNIERDPGFNQIRCNIYISEKYPDIPDVLYCTVNNIQTCDFELTDGERLKWQQYLLTKGCDERLKDNPYLKDLADITKTKLDEALQYANDIEKGEGNKITNALNAQYYMGQFHAYMEMLLAEDIDKYVEIGDKTRETRQKILEMINTIYE